MIRGSGILVNLKSLNNIRVHSFNGILYRKLPLLFAVFFNKRRGFVRFFLVSYFLRQPEKKHLHISPISDINTRCRFTLTNLLHTKKTLSNANAKRDILMLDGAPPLLRIILSSNPNLMLEGQSSQPSL